jgi:hypothetical protein
MQTRILTATAVAALAFGGGAPLAATHGSHHAAKQPAKAKPVASNVHYPCRHHDGAASKTLAPQL